MKILYYYKDFPTPMYQWQHVHIIDELEHYGCYIEIFNPLNYESVEQANEEVIKRCKVKKYDLFMTPHNEKDLYVETIEQIKKIGLPTLLICFDNLVVPFMHENVASMYDAVWLTSIETKDFFDKRNCKTIFLPYAANPYIDVKPTNEILGVGFAGTPYGSRANMINHLTENGINVYVHYSEKNNDKAPVQTSSYDMDVILNYLRFKEGRRIIAGALKNKMVGNSVININEYFHKCNPYAPSKIYLAYSMYALALSSTAARNTGVLKKPLNIVNLRSFEIPMSGGIQFCHYFDELAEYFEEGKEIVFYRNEEEMLDKARYYLAPEREKERQAIRIAARKRAEAEHTWFCRFSKAFDMLGVKY